MTWAEKKKNLREILWPGREARSQRPAHDVMFRDAAADLQRWLDDLKVKNTTVYKFQSTYFWRGLTVIEAPIGFIRRVYTIANDKWDDPVYYEREEYHQVECWSDHLLTYTIPNNKGFPKLPMGYRFAESSTDSDCGRARLGIWGLHRHRLYVAPYIQSNEKLIVEWDGIKKVWEEEDVIDERIWDSDVDEAIRYFVAWKHESFFGKDPEARNNLQREYDNKLGDLRWEEQQRNQRPVDDETCHIEPVSPSAEELEDDAVPTAEVYKTGIIGNYGLAGTNAKKVADMFTALVGRIVTTGGNSLDSNIDKNIGQYYSDFLYPYDPDGAYSSDATENKLFPSWGKPDWDLGDSLAGLLDYFTLPNNERFYGFHFGPVHFFILSSDSRESDLGYVDASTSTEDSKEGEYIKTLAALSTAKWKVAVVPDAPYTSEATKRPGAQWMRWGYKAAGFDAVIGGGSSVYEHLQVDGLDYFVIGLGGGTSKDSFGAALTESKKRYNADFGALLLTATCDEMKFEMKDTAGTVVHTVTIK